MKTFQELREGKVSAKFTDHTPNKDFNDLAKKNRLKVTHDKNSEVTTIHGDEKGVLSVLKTMYGNDWKHMYTKKGSTYVDESVNEAVGDTALAFQTPYGTVTAFKRNTKGMRGKQDGYSLSLKTKSGKTVDLGSHPKPTKANVLSIAKNMMSESVDLDEARIKMPKSKNWHIVTQGPGDNHQKIIAVFNNTQKAVAYRDNWNDKNDVPKPSHKARVFAHTPSEYSLIHNGDPKPKVGSRIAWSTYSDKMLYKKIK